MQIHVSRSLTTSLSPPSTQPDPPQAQDGATPYLIGIIVASVLVVLAIACICVACKRRRQRRLNNRSLNRNFQNNNVHYQQGKYMKVDGRIVGKNVGPNPVRFRKPQVQPVPPVSRNQNTYQQVRINRPVQNNSRPTSPSPHHQQRVIQPSNKVQFQNPPLAYPSLDYPPQNSQHLRPPILQKDLSQNSQNQINPYGFS